MLIRIRRIKVGQRRREEMGDIADLAESIQRHGLIQPIVVDADLNLVAGGRRLRACQLLGWEKIEVRQLGGLSAQELRLLEMEENIRRKDLTEYEKAKAMVAYVETVREVAQEEAEELRSESPRNAQRGRPSQPGSYRDIEQRTGLEPRTIQRAETQVSTADKFPVMQSCPQYRVLEAKECIDNLPEEEHQAINKLLSDPFTQPDTGLKILRNLAAKSPEQRAQIYTAHDSDDPHQRSRALTMAANPPPMPDERVVLTQEAWRLLHKAAYLSNDRYQEDLIWACMTLMALEQRIAGSVK